MHNIIIADRLATTAVSHIYALMRNLYYIIIHVDYFDGKVKK